MRTEERKIETTSVSCQNEKIMNFRLSLLIQTHKRFKRTLFIRTRQPANFRYNPLYEATKRQLNKQINGEKRLKMRWKAKPFICFGLSYVIFLSCYFPYWNTYLSANVSLLLLSLQVLLLQVIVLAILCILVWSGFWSPQVLLNNTV